MEAKMKPAWQSKTYWANLVLASACELHPAIEHWVCVHPQSAILTCALINLVLRHFTSSGVSYAKTQG